MPPQYTLSSRYAELRTAGVRELLAVVEEEQARSEIADAVRKLRREAAAAQTPAEREAIHRRVQELRARRPEPEGRDHPGPGARGGARLPPNLVRASELPAPAPEGHFLRQFGQSDRELIDNGNRAPTIPQALTLMNAWADSDLLHPQGVLAQSLRAATSDQARRELVFQSVLGRRPSAAELALVASLGGGAEPKSWIDLVWALVNSHEFLFQR